jgi:NADPH-dependent curcumin reductase CurA
MSERANAAWHLVRRPDGLLKAGDMEWRKSELPPLGEGEVLVRQQLLSLDPTNRVWMNDADGYLPRLPLGSVMRGIGIGTVTESKHPKYSAGDTVQGMLGWQKYYQGSAEGMMKLPPIPLPLEAHFGLLGHIGLTAYFGLVDIGKPKEGETLVVSAAAGAVGSLVGQIGKILGMRVVGIAGGASKCAWLTNELGFDAAIDYKSANLNQELARLCPNGVDVYFDNVGGRMLEAVLNHINLHARIVACGMISQYNAQHPEPGPSNLGIVIGQRATIQGFIVLDYLSRAMEAGLKLVSWHMSGRLQYRVDMVEGLEQAPEALNRLFSGKNQGKLVVRVGSQIN